MARDQYQGFTEFVAVRKPKSKQDGKYSFNLRHFCIGAEGQRSNAHRNSDEMVLYDGNMSHVPTYNFCYLCKERLDTYHDDQDEGWYFVNTKQIRINKDQS